MLPNISDTARATEHAVRPVDDEDPFQGPSIVTLASEAILVIQITMSSKNYHPLYILQYNTERSRNQVMATFLWESMTLEAIVITVQASWENKYEEVTHSLVN